MVSFDEPTRQRTEPSRERGQQGDKRDQGDQGDAPILILRNIQKRILQLIHTVLYIILSDKLAFKNCD